MFELSTNVRSAGDGMEDLKLSLTEMNRKDTIKCSKAPILGKSARSTKNNNTSQTVDLPIPMKKKEPKFIPYEPYKAAVTPIVPEQNKSIRSEKFLYKTKHNETKVALKETHIPFPLIFSPPLHKKSRNDVETAPLIRVLREVNIHNDDSLISEIKSDEVLWKKEKMAMQEEINKLKEEKRELEDQFKIQLEVNGELKKLLVASLGEDMQNRIQFLSEDKAKLAQDIEHYSQLLLDDREELERLSIQCDIWRSKFLAISLMVDELAGWKALLSRKYEESLEALQWMLTEHEELYHQIITTHNCLQQLQKAFDPTSIQIPQVIKVMNILQTTQAIKQLTELLHSRLIGNLSLHPTVGDVCNKIKETLSPAEIFAQKVLANKDVMKRIHKTDSPADGSSSLSLHFSNKLCYHYSHGTTKLSDSSYCRHCSGEIKVL